MAPPQDPAGTDTRNAPAFIVCSEKAEAARRALKDAGLLATRLTPTRIDGDVAFPLLDEAATHPLAPLLDRFQARVHSARFRKRSLHEADYRERLHHLDKALRDELPRAHDVIGDIAILKLPDVLQSHREEIANALLATHPRLRSVALDHGVGGTDRVRELEVLAGEGTLATTHREHGLRLQVEPDRVYFSPRLATERARLLERIQDGQRVLDLFCGIGAFVCLAVRERDLHALAAIDQNPHATRLLQHNLRLNKIPPEQVTVLQGDAREKAPRTRDWDHVVMNLPHDAHHFLDVAAACVAPQGEVHLYAILERDEEDDYVHNALLSLQKHTGRAWELVERRHVRQYAPTMDGLGFAFA